MGSPNDFAETAALLAVLNEDSARLVAVLRDMHPIEMLALADSCDKLAAVARIAADAQTGDQK